MGTGTKFVGFTAGKKSSEFVTVLSASVLSNLYGTRPVSFPSYIPVSCFHSGYVICATRLFLSTTIKLQTKPRGYLVLRMYTDMVIPDILSYIRQNL